MATKVEEKREAMSFYIFLIVCPLVFIGGLVDAIAGGGGLITLPAYMIAGLPAINAIATNKMSSSMGTTIATIKYGSDGFIPWKLVPFCVAGAFLGSSIGSNLALLVSDRYFKIVMLIILPLTALYILRSKGLSADKEPLGLGRTILISLAAAFCIGIYDGFYGPGTGTFLLLLLTGLAHMELTKANGLTKVINLTSNIAALTVYLINGKALLLLGLCAGVFNIAGNYIGATMFKKGGAKFTRPVMILVLAIFFVKVLYELITK